MPLEGGLPQQYPYGLAQHISFGANGAVILGRHTGDPAMWKRYRGGTAGVFWIDRKGDGNFTRFKPTDGNLTAPMWIGERIYFVSDHEGIANLYSCLPTEATCASTPTTPNTMCATPARTASASCTTQAQTCMCWTWRRARTE